MIEKIARWIGHNLKIAGMTRLLSIIYPCIPSANRYLSGVYDLPDGLRMKLDSRNIIDWNLIFQGEYEPHVTRLLKQLSPIGGVAVDVGANIGRHTLSLAQSVGSAGTVLAFEPNPKIYAILQSNIALNQLNHSRAYDIALGDAKGIASLRVPKEGTAEYSNMGLASISALDTPHDLVNVQVRSLDDVIADTDIARLDVVKIDVQGYECKVLDGMRDILSKYSPAVVFEYEAWAWQKAGADIDHAIQLFHAAGYSLWQIFDLSVKPLVLTSHIPEHVELLALKQNDPRLDQLLSGVVTA